MATVSDIRINGQASSASSNPVVAGLNPVITWEFDQDVSAPSQSYYEIRIGINSLNWGLDDFAGEIKSLLVENSANVYEHFDHSLSRGRTYYGQVRVKDPDGDFTPWAQFNFRINQLPFVTGYILSPDSPLPQQDVELNYTYHDPDDHSESGTKIRWFKNNILQSSYDDMCILPSTATNPGESWTAKIIPSDGLEFGTVVETQAVTIQEPDVTFSNITILPVDANVDDILKVEYDLIQNEYTDITGTIEYEWYVNGVVEPNSNQKYIRLELDPGDEVSVVVKISDGDTILAQNRSLDKTILDVSWYIYDLEISGQTTPINLTDLEPVLEWKIHKTTADINEKPEYVRIIITKTPSLDSPILDTGVIEYVKNSYVVPSGILNRGQKYFFHVGAGDENPIDSEMFLTKEVVTAGSSWSMNVSNAVGWTIETRLQLETEEGSDTNLGMYIHDGTYFCAIIFGLRTVKFQSRNLVEYEYQSNMSDLRSAKTFRISAKDENIKIYMDSKLIIDGIGALNDPSKLKFIEYGDIDTRNTNQGVFRFVRYSTNGAYGLDTDLPDENTFLFSSVGKLTGGEIRYVYDNLISWLPEDTSESAKIIQFNETSRSIRLPTVTRNYSPITSIFIDERQNKYIGTANGVTGIFGDKHTADYQFSTTGNNIKITPENFDRISTVPKAFLADVERIENGWIELDTTYRAVPAVDDPNSLIVNPDGEDVYNPYIPSQKIHAIHYYTQRVHGHSWFDNVENSKGWSVSFSLDIDKIEADDYIRQNLDKHGFGVYVNDGTYQEIIYFYEDRIRLYYANVYVPLNTKLERDYTIVAKDKNIFIYQKIKGNTTPAFLVLDGSGMFITPASKTGNSRKPKLALDSQGIYHAVWHDDSNTRSQIFYSSYNGNEWSTPELVTQTNQFNLRNPDVDVDSLGRVWVAYEDNSWGPTEISISVRDEAGWNPRTRITNSQSSKARPAIKVDSDQNVHVVWEDNRNGNWNIMWAEWQNDKQAWISSAQFGQESVVMQFDSEDPYFTDEYGAETIDFKNAKLSLLDNKLWLVCEAHFIDENHSAIYRGFRNLDTKLWISCGSIITDEDGNFSSIASGFLTSPIDRNCVNPTIACSESKDIVVIAWEDQTEPVYQIWATAINGFNTTVVVSEKITNQTSNCINPSVGWAGNNAVILFSKNRGVYLNYFNGNLQRFFGSATGGEDRLISLSDSKNAANVAVAQFSPSQGFRIVYDFISDRDPYTVSTIETPEFYMIGDAMIEHVEASTFSFVTTTTTISEGSVSNFDSKEFAFGDFSENVGLAARWANISMYFGYDSRPYNIVKFNTNSVEEWPDNRVTDVFVDVFGNIIASTFGGLLYYNIYTGKITNIQGHTSTFNQTTECTEDTCLLKDKLITSVEWGKNGIWYVGTTSGAFFSRTAGRVWEKLFPTVLGEKIITDIAVDKLGRAILSAFKKTQESNDGIFVAHPDMSEPINIVTPNQEIKCVAIDENDVIWAGSDNGLFRIENFTANNILTFNRDQGMRSSHVNDIAIVNKHLRYVATATGIERMHGSRFTNFNVRSHSLLNDNISTLEWHEKTNSLWVGALYTLHEIVFRDTAHDIIENETVHYDSSQISTEEVYDKNIYSVLDFAQIQPNEDDPLIFSPETASVFINRNKIDFGYLVNETAQSVSFLCNLLVEDEVDVELSNKFLLYHDFNQTAIEKSVLGEKRTSIEKIDKTSRSQLLLLSALDKPGILLDGGMSNFPFATLMLDRDAPIGCIEKLETVNRTVLRFKILASDNLSGLDGMILSNYENFTSDGETPLDYQAFSSIVEHDVGSDLTSVITSLKFEDTVTINSIEWSVGHGTSLGTWYDQAQNKEFLYAGTSERAIIFRYDPETDEWEGIQVLDEVDENRTINEMKNINNILWVTTGTETSASSGGIYRSVNGITFELIGNVTGGHVRGVVGANDGTVYFGSSDGKIYSYKDSILSVKYQNIGQSIYSLALFGNTLVAATGERGRVYIVDLETDNNLIIFDGSEEFIKDVLVKDAEVITSPDQAVLYAASGELTTIYKARFDDFGFTRSFNSFGKTIRRLRSVNSVALVDPAETQGVSGTTVVAAVGTDIFKHVNPGWEFVYKNSEEIQDIVQYFNNGVEGIWMISDTKVVKWTAVRNTKTVFLRLKDKAGNISRQPEVGDEYLCPTESSTICCNYAYSINIQDLQGFVNESRIVDVSEYGQVQFSYDSPNKRPFFSGDQIDQEVGIYTSEIFNGSNDLVSWKSIGWISVEPENTSVSIQIRSSVTEDGVEDEDWSADLEKGNTGIVSLEHITDQYIQFRAILTSSQRDISPSLTSVTLRNLTAQASHFFTTNFVLPSRPVKGLLTANTFIPVSADVVFGINTKNSIDFGDYQLIEANRLFTAVQGQFGTNLRIGAKLLSPNIPQVSATNNPGDPYDASSYVCNIQFTYENIGSTAADYHFRIRFYNDRFRTQLVYTFFTGNDQTGWTSGGSSDNFPATGLPIDAGSSQTVVFTPNDLVETDQKWYVTVDAYDGANFETVSDNQSFICSACNIVNEPGLVGQYYGGFATMSAVPDFNDFVPGFTVIDSTINFSPITTEWVTTDGTVLSEDFVNRFAVRWRGKVLAPISGTYTFKLVSDDGSVLIIDAEEVVNFDGIHDETEKTGSVSLDQGFHDIEVQYFANLGPAYCQVHWILPGETTYSAIPASNFYHAVATEYCEGDQPRILNFAILFELENGETVKVNI